MDHMVDQPGELKAARLGADQIGIKSGIEMREQREDWRLKNGEFSRVGSTPRRVGMNRNKDWRYDQG